MLRRRQNTGELRRRQNMGELRRRQNTGERYEGVRARIVTEDVGASPGRTSQPVSPHIVPEDDRNVTDISQIIHHNRFSRT